MEEEIKSFLQYLEKERKYSSNTLASYRNDLYQLNSYLGSKRGSHIKKQSPQREINAAVLAGYMRSLRERKYTSSTVARKVAAVKSFIKYLTEKGRLRDDLTPQLASPHVGKLRPKPLAIAEINRLLTEPTKSDSVEASRDKAMLELLYATGLRASELVGLNVKDVDFKFCRIRCAGGSARARIIPLTPQIIKLLKDYMNGARLQLINDEEEIALFVNHRGSRLTRQGFWKIIQGYAEKIGLKNEVTPRALRHSYAIHSLRKGADLEAVQQLMGHSHISTTRAYKQVKIDT